MTASEQLRVLSVRLPEAELRRFKTLAANRGVSLQEAVHQALNAWGSGYPKTSPEPLDVLEGSLADVDLTDLLEKDTELELAKDERRS